MPSINTEVICVQMQKMVVFHRLTNERQRPALERWFRRQHVPDVLVQAPWMVRYLLYRPVPPPPGAEAYACYNYRIHENWALDFGLRRGKKGLLGMTPEPGAKAIQAQIVHIPAEPTEDFFGQGLLLESQSILRWVVAFRYPEGVDKQLCDDWYLNVHVPETMKQKGLIRFFSHKAVEFEGNPLPITTDDNKQARTGWARHWDRLSELWYEDIDGWAASVLESPLSYTKPDWATWDRYPFMKPEEDFISTFLLESPDCDFMKSFSPAYY